MVIIHKCGEVGVRNTFGCMIFLCIYGFILPLSISRAMLLSGFSLMKPNTILIVGLISM
jgi:hypothetical protein